MSDAKFEVKLTIKWLERMIKDKSVDTYQLEETICSLVGMDIEIDRFAVKNKELEAMCSFNASEALKWRTMFQNERDHMNAAQEEIVRLRGKLEVAQAVTHLSHLRNDQLEAKCAALERELAEAQVCISNQRSMLDGKHEYIGQDFKMRMDRLTQRAEQAEARAAALPDDVAVIIVEEWYDADESGLQLIRRVEAYKNAHR